MASKIKKGDKVFIISGKDKGKEGEVTKIINPQFGSTHLPCCLIRSISRSRPSAAGTLYLTHFLPT